MATKRAHDPPRPAENNGQRSEEYDRFERLTKKLVLVPVPKKEIEKQAEKRKKAA